MTNPIAERLAYLQTKIDNARCDDPDATYWRYEVMALTWLAPKVADAINKAFTGGKEHTLSTDGARFAANAMLTGTWEWEALEEARDAERERWANLVGSRLADLRAELDAADHPKSIARIRGQIDILEEIAPKVFTRV